MYFLTFVLVCFWKIASPKLVMLIGRSSLTKPVRYDGSRGRVSTMLITIRIDAFFSF